MCIRAHVDADGVNACRSIAVVVAAVAQLLLLVWLLQNESYSHCLVFCNSREQADQLYILMQQKEISAGILHGGRDQKQRNQAMGKLRRNQIRVIIATDIAARGIDIEGMDLVINFDMPRRGELYIHRIGRTGRAGEKGVSISFASEDNAFLLPEIEALLGQSLKCTQVPVDLVNS